MPEISGYRLGRGLPSSYRIGRALLLAAPLLVAVGCGSDDDVTETRDAASASSDEPDEQSTTTSSVAPTTVATTTTTAAPATTTTAAPAEPAISLTVEVTADDLEVRNGTLACGDTAEGTGHLADVEAARAACDLLGDDSAQNRLVEGYQQDEDMMCTMQYGGPDVATVTGSVAGQSVETTFTRQDGCAITDFDGFEPLIGAPSTGG